MHRTLVCLAVTSLTKMTTPTARSVSMLMILFISLLTILLRPNPMDSQTTCDSSFYGPCGVFFRDTFSAVHHFWQSDCAPKSNRLHISPCQRYHPWYHTLLYGPIDWCMSGIQQRWGITNVSRMMPEIPQHCRFHRMACSECTTQPCPFLLISFGLQQQTIAKSPQCHPLCFTLHPLHNWLWLYLFL